MGIIPNTINDDIKKYHHHLSETLDTDKHNQSRLYHYTSYEGVKGIISSKNLRLYNLYEQNDAHEVRHGLKIFIKILENYTNDKNCNIKFFAEKLIEFSQYGYKDIAYFYLSCFSRLGNDPKQWEKFSDHGAGCCLQFSPKIVDAFEAYGCSVSYDETSLELVFLDVYKQAMSIIFKAEQEAINTKFDIKDVMRELSETLIMHVLTRCLDYKHIEFSEENEYRFLDIYSTHKIGINDKPLKTFSDEKNRSYTKYFFPIESLETIWMGPNFKNQEELKLLLKDSGYHNILLRNC